MPVETHPRSCKSPSPKKVKLPNPKKVKKPTVKAGKGKGRGTDSSKKAASSPPKKRGVTRSSASAAAKAVTSPASKNTSHPITPEDETNTKQPKAVQKKGAPEGEASGSDDEARGLDKTNKRKFVLETQQSDDEVVSDASDGQSILPMDKSPMQKSPMDDASTSEAEDSPTRTPTSGRKRTKKRSKRSLRKEALDRLQKDGYRKNVHAHARQAVFNAAPFVGEGRAPSQHLYWARDPPQNCAQRLIARTPALQKEAAVFDGGVEAFALDIAEEVTFHCRKARNKHINQLRVLFFTNKFGFAIGKHVLESDSTDRRGEPLPMKVDEAFRETLPTTKEMANLLMSSKMHAHPVFYKHFVAALASGKLCTIKKAPDSAALSSFIGVNHEAHFRLELWLCLNKQGL